MLHAVIMAGGSGTRFWPRSTRDCPKQFLNIFGDKSMLQQTVDRVSELISDERVWVVTNDRYVGLVKEQLPGIPDSNIIGEPVARNTAPCVASAAALLNENDPDATMLVLPADHYITRPGAFRSILQTASQKAEDGVLVTIGITPDRPETGYGYIEFEEASGDIIRDNPVKRVSQFREKPDRNTAEQFIEAGNFLWNSGMFVWKASVITDQFKRHLPDVYEQMVKLSPAIGSQNQEKAIAEFYRACPSISIDFGIMEKADSVYVVPGEFGWNDVGSWRAVYDLRVKDDNGNTVQASHVTLTGSKGNLVHSGSDKMIALVGVDNLAVVETDDAILVCSLDQAQDVKKVVERLREDKENQKYL